MATVGGYRIGPAVSVGQSGSVGSGGLGATSISYTAPSEGYAMVMFYATITPAGYASGAPVAQAQAINDGLTIAQQSVTSATASVIIGAAYGTGITQPMSNYIIIPAGTTLTLTVNAGTGSTFIIAGSYNMRIKGLSFING